MSKREVRQEQRERVAREFHAATVAVGLLDQLLGRDPSALGLHALGRSDYENLRRNLESTFFVRLFAEFESGLRDVWRHTVRDSNPRTVELIDALAARRNVDEPVVTAVHAARGYRNALVHEGADLATPVPLATAARSLRRYFARMPVDW